MNWGKCKCEMTNPSCCVAAASLLAFQLLLISISYHYNLYYYCLVHCGLYRFMGCVMCVCCNFLPSPPSMTCFLLRLYFDEITLDNVFFLLDFKFEASNYSGQRTN